MNGMDDFGEYKEFARIELSKDTSRVLMALSIVMTFAFMNIFILIYTLITGNNVLSSEFNMTAFSALLVFLEFITVSAFTVIAHEWVHGQVFKLCGGKPRYGYGMTGLLPYFYCASDGLYKRNRYLLDLVAPLAVISITGIAIMGIFPRVAWLALLLLILNSVGAVGDLWLAFILLRYPADALLSDYGKGVIVYLKNPGSARISGIPAAGIVVNFSVAMVMTFVILLLGSTIVIPILSVILQVDHLVIGLKGTVFAILEFSRGESGMNVFISPLMTLAASIIIGAIYALARAVVPNGQKKAGN